MRLKKGVLNLIIILVPVCCYAQDSLTTKQENKKWFIALPLRFTQLQSSNTMLSGIKLGKEISSRFSIALSIYHSFYLKSFRAEANLTGFDEQPRLFINGMGLETEYTFLRSRKFSTSIQLLTGWGFMTYDLKEYEFKSKKVNYLILEPCLNTEYRINSSTAIGLGLGYRPLFSGKNISYTSALGNDEIVIHKDFPNGLNIILSLKGYL